MWIARIALIAALALTVAHAQEQKDVDITVEELAKGVYMLTGQGGNIGISAGKDGVFLIDDQYAPLTPAIRKAIAKLTDQPVRMVFNTHWHEDHTGGNENFGKAGSVIIAHDNVRRRLAAGQTLKFVGEDREVPPAPEAALPVVTFDSTVTFHLNGDEVHAFHVRHAHTDGDAIVHFRNANVVHMGDTYFNGFYPFIDASSGGSLAGMVAAVDQALELIDENTKVIPGHGPLSNRAELVAYRDMLATVHERMKKMTDDGLSLEDVQAQRPTAEFDAQWGNGFIPPGKWVEMIYGQMSRPGQGAARSDDD